MSTGATVTLEETDLLQRSLEQLPGFSSSWATGMFSAPSQPLVRGCCRSDMALQHGHLVPQSQQDRDPASKPEVTVFYNPITLFIFYSLKARH